MMDAERHRLTARRLLILQLDKRSTQKNTPEEGEEGERVDNNKMTNASTSVHCIHIWVGD